ncbi:MAG: His-Xaa-Ser system protein HxsD [Elusimicrobiota bacterium]|jgi:His-Xaa-Ser system protein HxsD
MILKIDTKVYPLEAVQAAAYSLTDRVYARVARKGAEAAVTLKPKAGGDGAARLEDEFFNELLHQTLRLRVSESNQKIREYIVTKALVSAQVPSSMPEEPAPADGPDPDCPECQAEAKAKAGQAGPAAPPVDEELEKEIEKLLAEIEKSGPASDDPLGVAVPWEQKHQPQGRPAPGGESVPLAGGGGGKRGKAAAAKGRKKPA